jgi:hypothetical protein
MNAHDVQERYDDVTSLTHDPFSGAVCMLALHI